ncbi:uncharacterized protein LOC129617792 [Condylostylus longicornis]|uniref:uncharacterized protein LOC129617792 n=1 Tax=Condylostylus longicornis TaxID=2530218 RepID=UPI00244E08E8|nr:uncharacterized protein LOC129617792 [Condylostylus longicornis]
MSKCGKDAVPPCASPVSVTQSDDSTRFLICGDTDGEFATLAFHLRAVEQRQGPFSFVLCCGKFFGDNNPLEISTVSSSAQENVKGSEEKNGDSQDPSSSNASYINGEVQFPVPVYFIDSSACPISEYLRVEHPDGLAITSTLRFLGAFGFYNISGFTIGYLCGKYDSSVFFEEMDDEESIELPIHAEAEEEALNENVSCKNVSDSDRKGNRRKFFGGLYSSFYCRSTLQRLKEIGATHIGKTDIFVSCEWPAGLDEALLVQQKQDYASVIALSQQEKLKSLKTESLLSSSPAVSEIVEMLEPRFHIAAGEDVFYQRPIYRTSERGLASRFIGLGPLRFAQRVAAEKRLKFIHSLILKPMTKLSDQTILAVPLSSTSSPYFSLYNPRSTSITSQSLESPSRFKRSRSESHPFPASSPARVPCVSDFVRGSDDPTEAKRQRVSDPVPPLSQSPLGVLKSLFSNNSDAASPWSNKPRDESESCTSIYVTNIPYEVDQESFMEVMKSFGSIASHSFPRSSEGKSAGRAWITYDGIQSAERAVAATDRLEAGGRSLKIQFNHSFSSRKKFPEEKQLQRRSSQAIDVRPHSDCWFCLANPNCEKRLIVAIGDKVGPNLSLIFFDSFSFSQLLHELIPSFQVYVALAKGGIVHQHVLIIPVTHWPNFSRAERAGACLQVLAKDETISSLRRRIVDPVTQSYFYVELPGSHPDQVERLLYTTPSSSDNQANRLPFNFGREAIAALMDIPQRSDWKRCVESESVEIQLAQQMQKLFCSFQPK